MNHKTTPPVLMPDGAARRGAGGTSFARIGLKRPACVLPAVLLASMLTLILVLAAAQPLRADSEAMPKHFTKLEDVDPTIVQDMRFASEYNFTGQVVPGYERPVCILQTRVAMALKRVQARLREQGLTLKVLDCYRPRRAVRFMWKWVRKGPAAERTKKFYPRIKRRDLIRRKYISFQSNHMTGRAVDVTIEKIDTPARPRTWNRPCHLPPLVKEGEVDMGTEYDCKDTLSHTFNRAVGEEALRWRRLLVKEMARQKFRNYRREWWHFDYRGRASEKRWNFLVQ